MIHASRQLKEIPHIQIALTVRGHNTPYVRRPSVAPLLFVIRDETPNRIPPLLTHQKTRIVPRIDDASSIGYYSDAASVEGGLLHMRIRPINVVSALEQQLKEIRLLRIAERLPSAIPSSIIGDHILSPEKPVVRPEYDAAPDHRSVAKLKAHPVLPPGEKDRLTFT